MSFQRLEEKWRGGEEEKNRTSGKNLAIVAGKDNVKRDPA